MWSNFKFGFVELTKRRAEPTQALMYESIATSHLREEVVEQRCSHSRLCFLRSPCAVGAVWAMRRDFFFTVGGLDRGMKMWGGENLDLSIRVRVSYFIAINSRPASTNLEYRYIFRRLWRVVVT